jgi:sulfur carrier protein
VKVVLNGDAREVQRAANIAELVEELALPAPAILIEHNGLALHRDEWKERTLGEGDRIEMIRIVAGG